MKVHVTWVRDPPMLVTFPKLQHQAGFVGTEGEILDKVERLSVPDAQRTLTSVVVVEDD